MQSIETNPKGKSRSFVSKLLVQSVSGYVVSICVPNVDKLQTLDFIYTNLIYLFMKYILLLIIWYNMLIGIFSDMLTRISHTNHFQFLRYNAMCYNKDV
jgi:hypothetical protein